MLACQAELMLRRQDGKNGYPKDSRLLYLADVRNRYAADQQHSSYEGPVPTCSVDTVLSPCACGRLSHPSQACHPHCRVPYWPTTAQHSLSSYVLHLPLIVPHPLTSPPRLTASPLEGPGLQSGNCPSLCPSLRAPTPSVCSCGSHAPSRGHGRGGLLQSTGVTEHW